MTSFTFDLPPYDPLDDMPHQAEPSAPVQEVPHASSTGDDHFGMTKTISLRMPTDLVNQVDRLALQEDISRSQAMRRITSYVLQAIRSEPGALKEYGKVASHLYDEAVDLVHREREFSVSLFQRHLRLDYRMAMLLKDELERAGVVVPPAVSAYRKSAIDD